MNYFAGGKNFTVIKVFTTILAIYIFNSHCFAQNLNFRQLTVENGLSQNAVMSIAQDKKGFLWYGTRYGLNRYDGINFKIYKSISGDPKSISDNIINALLVDSQGVLWVGTSTGLDRYNEEKDEFERINIASTNTTTPNINYISCLYEDKYKNIWVGASNGINLLTNRHTNKFEHRFDFINNENKKGNYVRVIYDGSNDGLLIGTSTGLVNIQNATGKFTYTIFKHDDNNPASLSAGYVTSITEDKQKNLWVGTLRDGINLYDKATNTFSHFEKATNVRKLLLDKSGKIWLGTQDGLKVLDPLTKQSELYQHDPENKTSLSNNSIHSIFQDKYGTTWIGTYHGGINISYSSTTPFTIYQNNRLGSSISSNVVSSVVEDEKSNLWIGTEGGGLNYLDRTTGKYTSYKNNIKDSTSISSNLIKIVYRDKAGHIWIGTSYGAGLNLFDPATKRFKRINIEKTNKEIVSFDEILAIQEDSYGNVWIGAQSGLTQIKKDANGSFPNHTTPVELNAQLHNKNIHALFEDSKKNLWIGTAAGLHMYNQQTQKLITFLKDEANTKSLQSDYINVINEDSKGRIIVGTFYGGLSIYEPTNNSFVTYTDKDGLPNNNILGIIEDNTHNLWLSTDNGLSKYTPATKTFKTYTTSDGLAGNKFSTNAFLKDSHGQLFFGGNNGMTAFFPSKIETNSYVAPVTFTGLKLFGNTVDIDTKDKLLAQNISSTKDLTFKYDQSNFTIDYALLNFIKPEKNKYAYKLEGLEENWNYVTTTSATYTNLPAGSYTLLVKAANNDGVWTQTPAALHITILPPLWKTWWAYTFYVLAGLAIIFFFLRFFWLRALFKREHELQQFKLNFFTNISHEIRTHLTLILGPVEKLLTSDKTDSDVSKQLGHVKSNADRLLNLVGELMDFRKAETNNLPLHATKENIVAFVEEIFTSFQDMALSRNIKISMLHNAKNIELYFDKRQMEKVIFNLLTNAFKFTPNGGYINIEIAETKGEATIKIVDNGKGIAPENLKNLFANFFQVEDNNSHNTGYGIGLALSKSIVELHKGNLSVESEQPLESAEGKTIFTVTLLKGNNHFEDSQLIPESKAVSTLLQHTSHFINEGNLISVVQKKPTVLLVEDNNELRAFINESLSMQYTIIESVNGVQGWEKATDNIPDLVISDVMMPEMDGITLCSKLKKDDRTSHIPVILLTAKASQDSHVEGLENGADAYITKPFSIQLLELQTRNLIAGRLSMRQKYSRQVLLEPKHVPVTTVEEDFLNRVMEIIEENMDDPDFSVATLATKVAMSQPVLYKKLKALTDMTVNDFIKSVRLKKAALLLLQKQMNVTEVAYAVGFSRRKHFSEEFKKQFGKTPSEYCNVVEE